MKKRKIIGLVIAGVFIATLAFATGTTIFKYGVTLGSSGTAIANCNHATVTIANGSTTGTLTLAGCTSTSRIVATVNNASTNGVYVKYVVPSTGSALVVLSGDPGTTGAVVRAISMR